MLHKKHLYFFLFFSILFYGCSKNDGTGLTPINSSNDKIVGASANDLLASSKYTSLTIEIQYMPGFQPDPGSINNLISFLNARLNKPGAIQVSETPITASGKSSLNTNDISLIEKNNRISFNTTNNIAVYILIADAAYADPTVLGVSYRNTSVCLFGSTIQQNSGGIGQVNRTKLYTTVIEHEMGHLLGLVDIGTPMITNHKDASHGNHCNNQNCLMYYASETTELLGFLLTGSIPTLDANCLSDLRGNGGR